MSSSSAGDARPEWTPGMAIRRKLRELAEDRALNRSMRYFAAAEGLAELERRLPPRRPPVAPHCPWCGVPLREAASSCPACSDLEQIRLGEIT